MTGDRRRRTLAAMYAQLIEGGTTPARRTDMDRIVTDEMVDHLHAELGPDGVIELTTVIAFANMTTRSNTALGIESEGFSAACGLKPLAEPDAVRSPA